MRETIQNQTLLFKIIQRSVSLLCTATSLSLNGPALCYTNPRSLVSRWSKLTSNLITCWLIDTQTKQIAELNEEHTILVSIILFCNSFFVTIKTDKKVAYKAYWDCNQKIAIASPHVTFHTSDCTLEGQVVVEEHILKASILNPCREQLKILSTTLNIHSYTNHVI